MPQRRSEKWTSAAVCSTMYQRPYITTRELSNNYIWTRTTYFQIKELPRPLFNCDELRVLSLMDNDVSFLPPAISTLVNLERLNLYKNCVACLPENIKFCISLEFLDLSVNPLDRFPENIISLTGLQELYLNDTYLEYLPANFGKLVNLRLLELRENCLTALPKTMNRLSHLTRLDIGNNEFTDLPDVVSALHNLTELWIDGNHIRRLSPQVAQLRKMVHFEAGNNRIESLPRDIGYWTRVVEFSVSNNEIASIPTTIGNMKNLVGLKLDENRLKTLPDAIGKLTNLEDLMLSHNYLTHLPSSTGLLRKLRVLTVDKNQLQSLPSELGSCTSVTTLSLRSNRITEVPAEIGHMSNLRVLNLVDNHLKYLPMSLLKLNNLCALWLSNNQSQPLVPLQQERNVETSQTVLTCFMLPQHKKSARDAKPTKNDDDDDDDVSSHHRQTKNHRHICFASDDVTAEQRSRLLRAPTPYPKELRAFSKHAKTIQRGLTVVPPSHDQSVKQQPEPGPKIKQAKVTPTSPNNTPDTKRPRPPPPAAASSYTNHNMASTSKFESPPCTHTQHNYNMDRTSSDETVAQPLICETNAIIREAKNMRTDHQSQMVAELQTTPDAPQPPPYHIAAAYSRQAQFFNARTPSPKQLAGDVIHCTVQLDMALEKMISLFARLTLNEVYRSSSFDRHHSSPRRFIQDVPSPSQHIVAPTPQRPALLSEWMDGPQPSTSLTYYYHDNTADTSPLHVAKLKTPIDPSKRRYKGSKQHASLTAQLDPALNNDSTSGLAAIDTHRNPPENLCKWVFGNHKNATVMQITFVKSPTFTITLTANWAKGIYIENVTGCDVLHVADKVLEVDGVDTTQYTTDEVLQLIDTLGNNTANGTTMMISRMK